MDKYCNDNCSTNCPTDTCSCDPNWKPRESCVAIGAYAGQELITKYCNDHCYLTTPTCPQNMCLCVD